MPQHINIIYFYLKVQNSLLLVMFWPTTSISQNDMCVTNFMFQQNVNYTYKQGDKKSDIEHVIFSTYLCDSVVHNSVASCAPDESMSKDLVNNKNGGGAGNVYELEIGTDYSIYLEVLW